MMLNRRMLARRLRAAAALGLFAGLLAYAVWPWLPMAGRGSRPRTIVLYGFSILGEVINQGVFPAFQKQWQEKRGERVELVSSFAGSGTITNQMIMGVPAEIALLSIELDALRLSTAGVVAAESWQRFPNAGIVNLTPFIILVRSGNPKRILDFADLARSGVQVVHPDPLTSGGANWAIIAEYGAGTRQRGDGEAGYDLLAGIWRNVVALAASARAARTQFENGFGDALVTYEQEALWDRSRGKLKSEIVYPHSTVLSEHMVVEVDRNIPARDRELIDAFTEFLWSETAQRIFVEYGFRSVDERLNRTHSGFGPVADPFRIRDFGGWQRARRDILEAVWKGRVLKELGK